MHSNDTMGVQSNYYLESIEKNIAYLTKVLELSEPEQLAMLKRSGIVAQSKAIPATD